tara:strand:- start:164 stop:310 length:147 start_codon:yes stop_codon:yes gene_type:complete
MSEECKTARNAVLIPLAILIILMTLFSSCATTNCGNTWGAAANCPAYR